MRFTLLGVGSAILFALLPFVLFSDLFYSAINSKYFFVVALIDLLSLVAAYGLYKGHYSISWKKRWLVLVLFLAVGADYAAGYFGVFFDKSLWSDIQRASGLIFLTHIALFSLILGEFLKKEDWVLLRRSIALSAGVFAALAILSSSGLGLKMQLLWINLGSEGLTIGNGTFAGVYLLLAFLISCIELVRTSDVRWRRALYACLTLIGLSPIMLNIGIFLGRTPLSALIENPALFLGSARASSATLLLFLLFMGGRYVMNRILQKERLGLALSLWSALMLGVVSLGVGLLFLSGSPVQKAYIESSTSARIIVWQSGLEAFKERPYFGWGPENFNDAYEKHFDNALYLEENIGEVWFDRAHNIIVDTLVATGSVGAAFSLLFSAIFMWTAYRAYRGRLIEGKEAAILASVIPAHFLQLQTGFDTVATYALFAVPLAYLLSLEREIEPGAVPRAYARHVHLVLAGALLLLATLSFRFAFYDELVRQKALVTTFQATSADVQKELIQTSLGQVSDWESLRLSTASFIKGAIEGAPQAADKEAYVKNVLETAVIYEEKLGQYLEKHPDYYRAKMNYAYLLITEAAFGAGPQKLVEARDILKDSHRLSPENPLTYGLESLVFLYGMNFNKAYERINAGLALNPSIEFSQEIKKYVDEQIKRWPKKNTLLLLKNL